MATGEKRILCPHCGGKVEHSGVFALWACTECKTLFNGPPPSKDTIVKPTFRFSPSKVNRPPQPPPPPPEPL